MSAPTMRLCLNTPHSFDPAAFAGQLAAALDAGDIASVRLRLTDVGEDELKSAAELLREVCHQREVALLATDRYRLAHECGLDGVHFEPGANAQIEARKLLGPDAIIGCACRASRHHGMIAAERGADYIAFGPVLAEDASDEDEVADRALFAWWQDMIETPVIADGGVTPEIAASLVGAADFVAAGRMVWRHADGPAAAVRAFLSAIKDAAG